jgi:hypothetical protein
VTRVDSWTAEWACTKLIENGGIKSARAIGTNHIELSVKDVQQPVHIATMSVEAVTAVDLQEVVSSRSIEFAMNIKGDALYDRSAIQFSKSVPIGLGGLGDLYTAAGEREFRNYLPKEARFILRGLEQHTAVSTVERLNNRLYLIERRAKSPLVILSLNDYDLTADSVRSGIQRFGNCDVILSSNPNCRASRESIAAAGHCGVKLLKWGELLGELNY